MFLRTKIKKNTIAVAVFSFNRPQYLKPVLESLEKNSDIQDMDFYMFQDGAVNQFSKRIAADEKEIEECVFAWGSAQLPNKVLVRRKKNVGIGINQFEAKVLLFDRLKYEEVIFIEDDLILSKNYIRLLRVMLAQFKEDKQVGFVTCHGITTHGETPVLSREEKSQILYKLKTGNPHLWAWGMWRDRWKAIKPYFLKYFSFIKNVDYRQRPLAQIVSFFYDEGFRLQVTSQDAGMFYALFKSKFILLNLCVNRGEYIGEQGEHMTPEIFSQMIFPRLQLDEFDEDEKVNRVEDYDKKEFRLINERAFRLPKIIYDIALLGHSYDIPSGKAGVFRVAEEVAAQLTESKLSSVSFCVSTDLKTLEKTISYLETKKSFKKTPFIRPSLLSRFVGQIYFVLSCIFLPLIQRSNQLARKFLLHIQRLNQLAKKAKHNITRIIGLQNFFSCLNNLIKLIKDPVFKIAAYITNRIIKEPYLYPLPLKGLDNFHVYHSPFYPIPKEIRGVKNLQRFITIHDMIPVIYPQFFTSGNKEFFEKILNSIKPDDWVICMSYATKDDLLKYVNIAPARVFVLYSAANKKIFYPCLDPQKIIETGRKYGIPDKPYVMTLNTLEPRKNMELVIRAFSKIVNSNNLNEICLVLVGDKGWHFNTIFEEASKNKILKDRIIFTGYVEDEDLAALYSGAECFLYPSFYEGFGLPVLEAMQCGAPVITSNTSSLPELVGDAGLMISPDDEAGLCEAILNVLNDDHLRETMSLRSIARAKEFSWDKNYQDLLAIYRKVILHDY